MPVSADVRRERAVHVNLFGSSLPKFRKRNQIQLFASAIVCFYYSLRGVNKSREEHPSDSTSSLSFSGVVNPSVLKATI
jgi:hypothetical protein